MGKTIKLRDLVNLIKDKASISKAALLCNSSAIRLAIIRSTTHFPSSPPNDHLISSLLTLGDASRATASTLISALIDRLRRTRNSIVALKCLLVIHHVIKRGPFILQDQLSIFPTSGGYNYLNLSAFRDSSAVALSAWVRFHARYIETLLSTSRVLGYFLGSSSSTIIKENQRMSSFLNSDLVKDVDSLVDLMVEICQVPDSITIGGDDDNRLVKEITGLICNDYLSSVNEILLRLGEFKERLSCLSFGDSVELACHLKRLEECRERLEGMYVIKKPSVVMMWTLVKELRDEVGMLKGGGGPKLLSYGGRLKVSESARFDRRVLEKVHSVRFQSGRFGVQV